MIEIVKTWLALKSDRRAVTALEYGLIAGVLVAGIAAAVGVMGTNINALFTTIAGQL